MILYFYNRVVKEPYRNKKRTVAIWVLEKLSHANKAHYIGQATMSTTAEIPKYIRPTDDYKVSDLVTLNIHDKSLLYEAILFLIDRDYLQPAGMMNDDIANASIKITSEGINALRDEVLEDEIMTYKNDLFYSYLRWWLPVAALIMSIVSIGLTTCKKSSGDNISVQRISPQPIPIDTNRKMPPLLQADTLSGKSDSSRNSNEK